VIKYNKVQPNKQYINCSFVIDCIIGLHDYGIQDILSRICLPMAVCQINRIN